MCRNKFPAGHVLGAPHRGARTRTTGGSAHGDPVKDGSAWRQGTVLTAALWIVSLATHLVLDAVTECSGRDEEGGKAKRVGVWPRCGGTASTGIRRR